MKETELCHLRAKDILKYTKLWNTHVKSTKHKETHDLWLYLIQIEGVIKMIKRTIISYLFVLGPTPNLMEFNEARNYGFVFI